MDKSEFEALRDLPDKVIKADIVFTPKNATTLFFQDVPVSNSLDLEVVLYGTFKPDIPTVTYNFVLKGVGPICRIDVNGTIHKDQGRTHKHGLQKDSCPRNNLPQAQNRPDFEKLTAKEAWDKICGMANITHEGRFEEPE